MESTRKLRDRVPKPAASQSKTTFLDESPSNPPQEAEIELMFETLLLYETENSPNCQVKS